MDIDHLVNAVMALLGGLVGAWIMALRARRSEARKDVATQGEQRRADSKVDRGQDRADIRLLFAEITKLHTEIDSLRQLHAAEIGALRQENAAIRQEHASCQQENAACRQENVALRGRVEALEKENAAQGSQLTAMRGEIVELKKGRA